ncbi:MAG: ribosome biogenesis GTP-binding protein YihA/YsxC [Gemmatimonadota bacterium]
MKIRSVEFVGAVARPGQAIPEGLPEVAFSGRSNVGKSSLINRLLGRTRTPVARVSNTPGKTREINFFRVDALPGPERTAANEADGKAPRQFFLVDLPGYGYARVPDEVRSTWKPLIEDYLHRSPALHGVFQLVDSRHGPTRDDLQMLGFLAELGTPTLVVLTKIDKLKRGQRDPRIRATAERLALDMEQIVPFSAVTGEGRDQLHGALEHLLQEAATS